MARERKAITERMKINALLDMACGAYHGAAHPAIWCLECDGPIGPGAQIQWDHRQALCHDGPHTFENIRPVHLECHKGKTKRDIQANAKVKRVTGETGTRAEKFAVAKKPLDEPREKSSGFTKRPPRPFKRQEGNVRQIHETRGE